MSDLAKRIADLSPDRRALLAERLKASGSAAAASVAEPLAVVGIGCRFPGGVTSPATFWRLLMSGTDAVTVVPTERWDPDALFDADPLRPGKIPTRWGAWLDRLGDFDAAFFGIAPREAARMDPQQRLLLEVAWEAVEDAGIPQESLSGSRTGVYIGTHVNDYSWMTFDDPLEIDAYASTGTAHSIVANRVSYAFDLRGPSIAVDTACSSSLVALHLACQAVRAGECDTALAGGVNLVLSPLWMLALAKLGMLSPDGRCRTFDARANGIVRGEGCGVVVVKRLSSALRNGDRIWALVRGTATNQDGRTNGLTAPNGLAQQAVVRTALEQAGIAPDQVGAIEAHGTGTVLGDPIEVEALAEVLGRGDPATNPCLLGSVKTNFGHLEGAAGIAGFIKVVLALTHEEWPALVHYEQSNPHLPLEGTRFVLSASARPWPRAEVPRIGGVSAFGFGGSNAHVVLEEATISSTPDETSHHPFLLPLSARSPAALTERVRAVAQQLRDTDPRTPTRDLCYTATRRRTRHEHGVVVAARSRSELQSRLEAVSSGASPVGTVHIRRDVVGLPGLAFVFSGQGSQWAGMGTVLAACDATFRAALEECDALVKTLAGWSLIEELARPTGSTRLQETEFAQPAIFAIQHALTSWLATAGIRPDVVAGHSVGEVAAAHAAGLLDLAEAVRVIVARGRAMQGATGGGRMLAVEADIDRVRALVSAARGALDLAAINSPTSCVISGAAGAIATAAAELEGEGVTVRQVAVQYAFHSSQMEGCAHDLERELRGLQARPSRLTFISTAGAQVDLATPAYWRHNVRHTVRMADAIEEAARLGCRTFLELGPHPVLVRSIRQCCETSAPEANVLASLHREQDEESALLLALGALHQLGYSADWPSVYPARGRVVSMPRYPWQREPFGIMPPREAPNSLVASRRETATHHVLGAALDSAIPTFEQTITRTSPSWVSEHRIHGQAIVPAAGFVVLASAIAETQGIAAPVIENLMIERALVAPPEGAVVQVTWQRGDIGHTVDVFGRHGERAPWVRYATAQVRADATTNRVGSPAAVQQDAAVRVLSGDTHYARLTALGAQFGPRYRCVDELRVGTCAAAGVVSIADDGPRCWPAILDGCIQVATALLHWDDLGAGPVYLPVSVRLARWTYSSTAALRVEATLRSHAAGEAVVDVRAWNHAHALAVELVGVHFRRAAALADGMDSTALTLYTPSWQPVPLSPAGQAPGGPWLIVGNPDGIGTRLARTLSQAGSSASVLTTDGPQGMPVPTETLAERLPGCRGVVCLSSLEAEISRADLSSAPAAVERALTTLTDVVRAVAESGSSPRLVLVTRGAVAVGSDGADVSLPQAPVWGLARVAGLEHPELACTSIDLDPGPAADLAGTLAAELLASDPEREIAWRHDVRYVGRLAVAPTPVGSGPRQLVRGVDRTIDSLAWAPLIRRQPSDSEIEVRVLAAGINFRDVLNALGEYPGETAPLGNECAGEVVRIGADVTDLRPGDRVMGVAFGSLATHVTAPAALFVRLPSGLTVVEAATCPIAYLTAAHALLELGGLRRGDRVLVHAGAGGVGLAAVAIAHRSGAEVVATAGSPAKRKFLNKLGVQHVFDSRSPHFARDVVATLGDRPIDIVLNSLTGDFIGASLGLLRSGGRFLEIGKRGIWRAEDMTAVRPDVSYHVIYLGDLCEREPDRVHAMLQSLGTDLAAAHLPPLPSASVSCDRVSDAFRAMAQARHIGKLALTFPQSSGDGLAAPFAVRDSASYLITGGLTGLGLAMAEWLAGRGAKALVLAGRRGASPEVERRIDALRSRGVAVLPVSADVADSEAVRGLFARLDAEMPPLAGVIHAAGIIDDAPLVDTDRLRFSRVLAPKVAGVCHLHTSCGDRPLDFFVLFASAAGLVGWPGQSAYAAANAFLDGFAHWRQARGLTALSIDWGPWSEAGMAAELSGAHQERFRRRGMNFIAPVSGARAFESAVETGLPQVAALRIDWQAFASASEDERHRRLVAHWEPDTPATRLDMSAAATSDFPSAFRAQSRTTRRSFLVRHITELALHTLGLAPTFALAPRQGLRDIGLDSLMAVELRNALQRLLARALPSTLLFDHPTIDALADFVWSEIGETARASAPAPDLPAAADTDALALLSDDDAEALLREELDMLRGQAHVKES